MKDSTSSFLDLARWVSAWLVFLGHLRNHLFPAYQEFIYTPVPVKAFVFITLFTRPAVMVFFVLSGYLVGRKVLEMSFTKSNVLDYLVSRVSRLYSVLIPALVLSLILYYVGGNVIDVNNPNQAGPATFSLKTMLLNLVFLQTVASPVYGGNYPLWSLANEFWYYILFPAVIAFFKVKKLLSRVAAAFVITFIVVLLSLGNSLFDNNSILAYFLIWNLGVLVHVLKRKLFGFGYSLVIFVGVSTYSRLYFPGGYLPVDFLLGLSFSLLLNSVIYTDFKISALEKMRTANKNMASFSYTLYLLHVPLIMTFLPLLFGVYPDDKMQPNMPSAWMIYLFASIAIPSVCYYVAKYTEFRVGVIKSSFWRFMIHLGALGRRMRGAW